MEGERRTWGRWLGLLIWVAGLSVWAFMPLHDTVLTGVIDDKATYAEFECAAPIDGDARPASFTLPELAPPLAYQHPPCEQVHTQNRRMLMANGVVVVVAVAGLVWFERRRRRIVADPTLEPVTADRSSSGTTDP